MNKKKKYAVWFMVCIGLTCLLLIYLSTGGKRWDVALNQYSVSEDGRILSMNVWVTGSMGYIRKCETKLQGDGLYLTFYSTYGLNGTGGKKDRFDLELDPSCSQIYFYNGKGRDGDEIYRLMLEKDPATGTWQKKSEQ